MSEENRTLEQIQRYIQVARDSVWVVEDSIQRITNGETPSNTLKGNIERNVSHLKLVISAQDVIDSGENISDLVAAIAAGEAKLAENIWPTETTTE
jgi:hypothetical protein